MKKSIALVVILLCITAIIAQELFIVNSSSETLSHVQIQNFTASNNFAQIGLWANQVVYNDNKIYVVNSGDNNIQGSDPKNEKYLSEILAQFDKGVDIETVQHESTPQENDSMAMTANE